MLERGVLIYVARDVERRQLADLGGVRDRAAENQDRRLYRVELPQSPDQIDTLRLRKTQIDDDQVDPVQFRLHPRDELVPVRDRHSAVACPFECRLEAVANEGRIVGDDDDFGGDRCSGTHDSEYRYGKFATVGFIADIVTISI